MQQSLGSRGCHDRRSPLAHNNEKRGGGLVELGQALVGSMGWDEMTRRVTCCLRSSEYLVLKYALT